MNTPGKFLHLLKTIPGQAVLAAAQIAALAVILWAVLRLYPGDRWLLVRLGSYFTPWLLLAAGAALLAAILSGRRWLLVTALAALLLTGSRYSYLVVPPAQSAAAYAPAASLRVMSFNVNYANPNAPDIAALILSELPDVVGLQEFTEPLQHALTPLLAAEYPYHIAGEIHGFSVALFSRHPISAYETPADTPRVLRAVIDAPGGPVVVWNVHPGTAISQYGWETQRALLAEIAGWLAQESEPVVILGDFNTTNQAENYQLIARRFTDVNKAVGQGFNFTFPDPAISRLAERLPWPVRLAVSIGPFVGIDHIFASHHFAPTSFKVVQPSAGSDHRPVIATLNRLE